MLSRGLQTFHSISSFFAIPTAVGTQTLTVDLSNNDLYVYKGGSYSVDAFSQSEVVCFAVGTRVPAEIGDVAVETLGLGDRVVTKSGAYRTVCWIASRTLMLGASPKQ